MKYEVTFHMNSGKEIGHLVEGVNEADAQFTIITNLKKPFYALEDDLVIVSSHVEYFHLTLREE
ncbi:hypothetical protein Q9R38_26110 [Priestia aryabhattai]|uniref:hypothetical protein n=1 Tax=Priestia aryabhattai TaxID=412384 RepID=UPI002882CBF3|nr:hypothetical protein [Priestia aryabhattai]MDT0150019.1 hypothetical protein [Priestia aryabhattai]MDT0155589.1 hypothetical protein [Priestia aryabhattai]